jgi:hypothetical protein
MRRYALNAPSVTLWQLTKAKRTGRSSESAGAVTVRPTRLPEPCSSVKRYQYSRAGSSPAARIRQVQSDSAAMAASAVATTSVKSRSRATSTASR